MKNKEKREIYFFSRLAKLINEDVEARLCEGGREQILLR